MSEGCLACDLTAGRRELSGGPIAETASWRVEHAVAPLGVGTLLVKPLRHCLHVADLDPAESTELGPLLQRASACVQRLARADQVYVCLWSHAGWTAGHVHFVVQPAWNHQRERHTGPGPTLQSELFLANEMPAVDEVEAVCERAREVWNTIPDGGPASMS